jgi:hypothetical protein
MFDRRQYI